MSPDTVLNTMFAWLPVIIVGAFLIMYVIGVVSDLIRDLKDR